MDHSDPFRDPRIPSQQALMLYTIKNETPYSPEASNTATPSPRYTPSTPPTLPQTSNIASITYLPTLPVALPFNQNPSLPGYDATVTYVSTDQTSSGQAESQKWIFEGKNASNFQCAYCTFATENIETIQQHMLQHEERTFECTICKKQFSNQLNFERHQSLFHLGEKTLKCKCCSAIFLRPRDHANHSIQHFKNDENIGCLVKFCNFTLKDFKEFSTHIKLFHHISKKIPVECKRCHRHSTSLETLLIHWCSQHYHSDNVQPESVPDSSFLSQPTSSMSVTESMTCQHCDIAFTDNILYSFHKSLHTESNPFRCVLCGKQTADKYKFTTHLVLSNHFPTN